MEVEITKGLPFTSPVPFFKIPGIPLKGTGYGRMEDTEGREEGIFQEIPGKTLQRPDRITSEIGTETQARQQVSLYAPVAGADELISSPAAEDQVGSAGRSLFCKILLNIKTSVVKEPAKAFQKPLPRDA